MSASVEGPNKLTLPLFKDRSALCVPTAKPGVHISHLTPPSSTYYLGFSSNFNTNLYVDCFGSSIKTLHITLQICRSKTDILPTCPLASRSAAREPNRSKSLSVWPLIPFRSLSKLRKHLCIPPPPHTHAHLQRISYACPQCHYCQAAVYTSLMPTTVTNPTRFITLHSKSCHRKACEWIDNVDQNQNV